jgi:Ca-activated chloride channel family protein
MAGSARVVSISCTCDRESIARDRSSRAHVVFEVRALGEGIDEARPPLSAVFAVDVSGSMQGPPIEQVIRSVEKLVDLFEDGDKVGIVAFSHGATEVCAVAPMTAQGKRALRQRARRLEANGGTNMEAGLRLAASLLGPRAPHERQIVLLLSDGAPNEGASSANELAAIVAGMRPKLSVSSLGYGVSHNEDVLSAISAAGGGQYHFIADPDMCQRELAKALGAAGDMVADGLELSLVPAEGVEIVRVLGNDRPRFGASGLTLPLPDMVGGARKLVVAEIDASPGSVERRRIDLLRAKLVYRRAGDATPRTCDAACAVDVSRAEGAFVAAARANVLLVRSEEVRAEARALADRGQFDGAAALLRALVREIEAAPGYVAADGSPLSEACELLVDEAMAMERRPSREQYLAFRKGQIMAKLGEESVGAGSVKVRGRYARALADATAGAFPEAFLVVEYGPAAGTRHPLGPDCVIGRTSSADIQVNSTSVSRRHTTVYALQGEFWVADLGSTNPTFVNGQALGSKPHKLTHGDRIAVGDVRLRYEEEA